MFLFTLLYFIIICHSGYIIDDYLKTPMGYWHKDCVHEVPSGSTIINQETTVIIKTPNGTIYSHHRCPHGIQNQQDIMSKLGIDKNVNGSGWQVYVKYNNKTNEPHYYQANWRVPIEPKQNGQIIYNFLMLQNTDWYPPQPPPSNQTVDSILTGLQYGKTSAGGNGNNWGVVNWYQSLSQDLYHSKMETVYYYDVLWAYFNKTADDTWFMEILGGAIPSTLTIQNSTLSSLSWVYIALNVYDVISCNQYPQKSAKCTEPYPPCNEMPYVNIYLDDPYQQIPWKKGTGQSPPVCDATIETYTVADPTDDVYITF